MGAASRKAKIELVSSAAGVDRGLNDARKKLRAFEREQARNDKISKRSTSSALGFGKSILAGAAGAAGFDMAGGLAGLATNVFDVEKELTRFQIDAQLGTDKMMGFRAEAMRVSQATGVSRQAIVEMAHAYQILTGDAAGAISNAQLFADVQNATGSSSGDIAATAAALHNMKLDPSQMRQAFDILVSQGHQGAIEIRDLAGQLSSLQPMFAAFTNGQSVRGIAELGAAAQVMRKGFGSAEEMATGFRGAMSQLMSPAVQKKLKKAGADIMHIDPKTKHAVLNDWIDIIGAIKKSKVGDDPIGLRSIFTNIRGFRGIQQAVNNYDEMKRLADEAENSNQVSKDSATYMASATGKLAVAWEHIRNSIAEALTPERIDKFADAMIKLADGIAAIVHGLDEVLGRVSGKDMGQALGQKIVEASQGMTPDQKAARADEMSKRAMAADVPTNAIDEAKLEAQLYAIKVLREQADTWRVGGAGTFDPKVLGQAIADALKSASIVVKADSNAIAKAGSNAPIHTTRPGGHR